MAKGFTQKRPSGPTVALTPRFRCSHGADKAVQDADDALATGRSTRALDAYLRALADHPRVGFCDRVLLARAAEAALAVRCPEIAHDLASAAVRRNGMQPVGAEAALTARALGLRARALLGLGRTEEAAAALRRAQGTVQRDTAVDLLVRLSAAEVQLAQAAPFDDWDSATDRLVSMLTRHNLNPSRPGVLPPLLIAVGRMFLAQGRLEPACQAFDMAAQHTAVTNWIGRKGLLAIGDQRPESDRRWQYAAAHWAEALCEEAHCRVAMGEVGHECFDGEALLVFGLAATSAANRGDCETAARLSACCAYLKDRPDSGRSVWTVPREPEADFLFLFADQVAQRRWAALHEGMEGMKVLAAAPETSSEPANSPQLAWWAARSDPQRLREAARAADEVFSRLNASAPETFGAMHERVGRTVGDLQTLIGGEPIVGDGRRTWQASGQESGPQAGQSAGPAQRSRNRPIAGTRSGTPGMLRLPTALPSPYKDMAAATPHAERPQPGALLRPPWLDEAARATGARRWTLLSAAAEAHRLGHGRVGSEHLLLAVSQDSDCAGLLRQFGISAAAVRRCVTSLIGPDSERLAAVPLSTRARAVLALAGTLARRQGAGGIRALHVLGALAMDGRGVGAHILTLLGADRPELLTRVRLHTAPVATVDLPTPAITGLPSLGRFTAAARRTVARAGTWAASSASGLVDPVLLLHAVAVDGWGQAPDLPPDLDGVHTAVGDADTRAASAQGMRPGLLSPRRAAGYEVRLTPAARRVLVTASAESARRGHPGVDVDHLARAIVLERTATDASGTSVTSRSDEDAPALDSGAQGVLDAAHASAAALGYPYIGPEHLAAALKDKRTAALKDKRTTVGEKGTETSLADGPDRSPGTGTQRLPAVPLPLTPCAVEVLEDAVTVARSAGRSNVTAADLRQAISRCASLSALRPLATSTTPATTDDGTAENQSTQRFHTALVRYLERALADIDKEMSRLLRLGHSTDGDETEHERRLQQVQDAGDEQLEVLRLLCCHDPDHYTARLTEGLFAMARRRHDALAPASLDEAARLARRLARAHPERTLQLARTLTEAGAVHQKAGRTEAALILYEEALDRLGTASGKPGCATDEPDLPADVADLRGRTLEHRAQCLASDGVEAETAALLLAFEHQRHRLAADPHALHRARVTSDIGRLAKRLGDLGRHDKVLVVTSRAIAAVGAPLTELAAVHDERARALFQLNRGDLGKSDLDSAVQLAPDDPFHLSRRGTHLLWTGPLDEAIADFDRALALAPTYTFPRRRRGEAHLCAGRYADALRDLDAVLQGSQGRAHAALLPRGQALRALGDVEASLRDLTAANAADPDCAWTRYQYALTLFAAGSADQARRQVGEAIRQGTAAYRVPHPWRFTSATNLAVLHAALGAGPQARRWLRTAFNYRHHPWTIADFHDDLDELARTLPERFALCADLVQAANEANGQAPAGP